MLALLPPYRAGMDLSRGMRLGRAPLGALPVWDGNSTYASLGMASSEKPEWQADRRSGLYWQLLGCIHPGKQLCDPDPPLVPCHHKQAVSQLILGGGGAASLSWAASHVAKPSLLSQRPGANVPFPRNRGASSPFLLLMALSSFSNPIL